MSNCKKCIYELPEFYDKEYNWMYCVKLDKRMENNEITKCDFYEKA